MLDFITLTDGYKLDHRRQYPEGTQYVYSNFTPRSSRVPGQDEVVFLGLQTFLKEYFMRQASLWFAKSEKVVISDYRRMLDRYFGPNDIETDHIRDLHRLGYIPLQFHALSEGERVPLKVPMFTMENTHPDFFWVTNYFETLISSAIWQPCTSATIAYRYRKLLNYYANKTGGSLDFVQWQGHDFAFRGLENPLAAATAGLGHLLSFSGSDSLPSIDLAEQDYYVGTVPIAGSVPATEHSVMCAGGKDTELDTFRRLLKLYPTGVVSVVSDTWDLWHVVDNILPQLKNEIMVRAGKLVIRPDSGDPVKILCGDGEAPEGSSASKGLVYRLWEIFGEKVNAKKYIELDSHIGAIYGDSITEDRAKHICQGLASMGFASTNVVLGIGSYTYQYVTRDTYGFAIKATHAVVTGEERFLFKDPKTDDGSKRSARGRIAVVRNELGKLEMVDGLSSNAWCDMATKDQMKRVWQDGSFVNNGKQSFHDMRKRLGVW